VEALKYLSGADVIGGQFSPYISADFTEEVGGSLGEAAGTDAGLFRDVLLDSPGTRNTKISHRQEASSMAKVGGTISHWVRELQEDLSSTASNIKKLRNTA
jgi:hypothetical protein